MDDESEETVQVLSGFDRAPRRRDPMSQQTGRNNAQTSQRANARGGRQLIVTRDYASVTLAAIGERGRLQPRPRVGRFARGQPSKHLSTASPCVGLTSTSSTLG